MLNFLHRGNVIKDGALYIYYGCCDTCISVAIVAVDEVLGYVLSFRK